MQRKVTCLIFHRPSCVGFSCNQKILVKVIIRLCILSTNFNKKRIRVFCLVLFSPCSYSYVSLLALNSCGNCSADWLNWEQDAYFIERKENMNKTFYLSVRVVWWCLKGFKGTAEMKGGHTHMGGVHSVPCCDSLNV